MVPYFVLVCTVTLLTVRGIGLTWLFPLWYDGMTCLYNSDGIAYQYRTVCAEQHSTAKDICLEGKSKRGPCLTFPLGAVDNCTTHTVL